VKMVDLDKRSISQQAMYSKVRDLIQSRYGYLGLQTQVEAVAEFGGSGGFQPVDYVVSGPNLGVLTRVGDQGIRILRSIPGVVDLEQVVSTGRGVGPSEISHYNRRRQVELTANLLPSASQQAVLQELDRKVRALGLGPQYDMTFTGQAIEQGRQGAAFMQSFMLSFLFMYLVLAAQFESWLHPVTILLSLPLTVPFALLSILFLHGSLNILSQLGILVLFGVVKKNAILQIDRANHLRALGLDRNAA